MHFGYGKVILFGEHFAVYDIPAIAGPVGKTTTAVVEESTTPGIEVVDNRKASSGYKEKYAEIQKEANKRMAEKMGVDAKVKITLAGDLYCGSGIGASAASCVAVARALSDYFKLGLSDEEINDVAFEGEKAYAGNPSGVDNTVATYGKLVFFKKNPPVMETIEVGKPFTIVIANTGITTKTKEAIAKVAAAKEKEPEKFEKIFAEADELVMLARKALEMGEPFGELMNRNHELLQEIGVSCEELDKLVEAARNAGALGAKMTGGGLGGYMVALAEDGEKVEKALKDAGAETTMVGRVE